MCADHVPKTALEKKAQQKMKKVQLNSEEVNIQLVLFYHNIKYQTCSKVTTTNRISCYISAY